MPDLVERGQHRGQQAAPMPECHLWWIGTGATRPHYLSLVKFAESARRPPENKRSIARSGYPAAMAVIVNDRPADAPRKTASTMTR